MMQEADRRKLILQYVKAINGWIRQGAEQFPHFFKGLEQMAWGLAVPTSRPRLESRN